MFSSLYPFFPSLLMWLFNTRWSCCNDCHQSFLLSFFSPLLPRRVESLRQKSNLFPATETTTKSWKWNSLLLPPSLPPPPSSPTSWVTFYQLWAWQVGEGRVRQEHWHRSLCMERFAFYSVCWWAHRCYSYRLQVIGKKKERECVCMIEGEIECVSISACWSAGPILQSRMELDHL